MSGLSAGYEPVRNPLQECPEGGSHVAMSDEAVGVSCRYCRTPMLLPQLCPTRTPEVHELGEFPMTCYLCHVEADS